MDKEVSFKSIGTIYTPFKRREGMPIQPAGGSEVEGKIVLEKGYETGLKDLDGFSHIVLIYHFHQSEGFNLEVTPFMDSVKRGVFSTCAPKRPNLIGLSVVELLKVEKNELWIKSVDILDETPLLDIKPYVPDFNPHQDIRTGWLEDAGKTVAERQSDSRFK